MFLPQVTWTWQDFEVNRGRAEFPVHLFHAVVKLLFIFASGGRLSEFVATIMKLARNFLHVSVKWRPPNFATFALRIAILLERDVFNVSHSGAVNKSTMAS